MNTYYIDLIDGDEYSDGMDIHRPRKDYKNIFLKAGDKILFKRGTFVREPLYSHSGNASGSITYGAYGEGKNPVFCGSIDISSPDLWIEIEKNIWECKHSLPSEVCNIIFNNCECCGTLCWTRDALSLQGDFWDNRFGIAEKKMCYPEQCVLMYSEKNPGEFYNHIECAVFGYRRLGDVSSYMIIENIDFINSGVHGLAGYGCNIKIKNCGFYFIGGGVWNKDLRIRFGNGVEFFNVAKDVSVEDCIFYDIYDSGVTHQGDGVCQTPENVKFDNNLFVKCGMAAYEGRDCVPVKSTFNGNICINAGEGFSRLGETMPRKSEIWPQPMGHHVFLWRMEDKTENGDLEIFDNVFGSAVYGAAVYSIISKPAESQVILDGNSYYGSKFCVPVKFADKCFKSFEEFDKELSIKHSKIYGDDSEIKNVVDKWLKEHNREGIKWLLFG